MGRALGKGRSVENHRLRSVEQAPIYMRGNNSGGEESLARADPAAIVVAVSTALVKHL